MNNDHSDFAEGDSGIVLAPIMSPIVRMAVTGEIKEETKMSPQSVDTNIFVGEILGIARDDNNSSEARVDAYRLIWKITIDRMKYDDLTLQDKPDD